MNQKLLPLIIPVIVLISGSPAGTCTIFNATYGDRTLVGNNEDWIDPGANVWFLPRSEGKYGRVYFGFGVGLSQGGMNEQGLFFDFAAVPYQQVEFSASKESYPGFLIEKVMEECGTVKEALKIFGKYSSPILSRAQIMIVDNTGASAIIEGDTTIVKTGSFQVMTNFRQSQNEPEPYSIERYTIAEKMLRDGDVSIENYRSILAATHQEQDSPTQYSNIYDLNKGEIYIYLFHNYADVVKLNLDEELQKGAHSLELRSLFPQIPYAADLYYQQNKRKERTVAQADTKTYAAFAGCYEILPDMVLTITRRDSSLFCHISGFSAYEIYPESDLDYFFKVMDAQVTFVKDETGSVNSLIFRFAGKEMSAKRIE